MFVDIFAEKLLFDGLTLNVSVVRGWIVDYPYFLAPG